MVKDQEHSRCSQEALPRITPCKKCKLCVHRSLKNPACTHSKRQRENSLKRSVHISAPKHCTLFHRQAVIEILFLLLKQIEKLQESQSKSQSRPDPWQLSIACSKLCIVCIKAQPGHRENRIHKHGSPSEKRGNMTSSRFSYPVSKALCGCHNLSPPFLQ